MTDAHHPGAGSAEAQEVSARAESYLADLRDWLTIPSISADPAHGDDLLRSARWLATALRRDGWPEARIWDDGSARPAVHAVWPGDGPTVLIYGHHDVAPIHDVQGWRHPPFEPVLRDGAVIARGAVAKGLLTSVRLALAAHLAATGRHRPAATLVLLAEGAGAVGSEHLERLVGAHRGELDCGLLLVFAPAPSAAEPTLLGEFGVPAHPGLPVLDGVASAPADRTQQDERLSTSLLLHNAVRLAGLLGDPRRNPAGIDLLDHGSAA
ncbi:M20/M25/M40 family metallo-hydrolase [Allokutzneria albata]|uniref:Peptidase family M20/M25/M40 n=1 Tax=Allokutzneria albata TaxID=211114 RepID=A0A1G9YGK4_ALLAB|nr:M20/M25/M40 family metallo-hydrolase [Allokutzneria albata]SDN07696.1 Peptidase family M20/M25/M40 [Allokutzneria albata]